MDLMFFWTYYIWKIFDLESLAYSFEGLPFSVGHFERLRKLLAYSFGVFLFFVGPGGENV